MSHEGCVDPRVMLFVMVTICLTFVKVESKDLLKLVLRGSLFYATRML